MKMNEKKSLSGDKEDVAEAMENVVIGEEGEEVDSEDVIMKYAGNPGMYNQNQPSMRGVSAGGFNKSLFKSASAAKSGSPCASSSTTSTKGPVWVGGKASEDKPDERDEKEDGQYLPPSMKMVEKDGEYKVVKKSLTERRYGSQLSRTYDIGKSCGVCGKISKSVGEEGHEGHSGCCADCRKSMNSVRWHDSHLS
jgi:hypothetical protein